MRHHYWEWPIASYLFLGGMGGGIFFFTAVLSFFVYPGNPLVGAVMAWPCFIAILALGLGCFLLVFELGQPLVFLRVFLKSTSIICWGARILSVNLIFGLIWFLSYVSWDWFVPVSSFLVGFRDVCLAISGFCGLCIMLYTGILLSSLKAHSFWATPVLPVLFTVSAMSTACAAITLSIGWWPAPFTLETVFASLEIGHGIIHTVDVILVAAEIAVLLIMVLSFLGAGNKTANMIAKRWVKGSYAPLFWIGMMGAGLLLPEILYVGWAGTIASSAVAPWLILFGGLLLRFLIVYSDERAALPGEEKFYKKLPSNDALFLHAWKDGKKLY